VSIFGSGVSVLEQNPPKQGLKQVERASKHLAGKGVLEKNPLKQGLKHLLNILVIGINKVLEKNPPKQGLNLIKSNI